MNTNNGCAFTNFQFKVFCSQWELTTTWGFLIIPSAKGS